MLSRRRGFTLVELLVTISLGALLMALAIPNFKTWIGNSRIRNVADAVQSGLRQAQTEAQRRAHTVVFFRTTSTACDNTSVASASGPNWQIRTVPNAAFSGDTADDVQCGVLADASSGVDLAGPAAVCFTGDGRQTASTNPASIGLDCAPDAQGAASTFDVTAHSGSTDSRPLRVLVALGGSVRLCDPKKTQSSSAPDGCPP